MKKFLTNVFVPFILLIGASPSILAVEPLQPGWPIPVHDDKLYSKLYIDRMEYAQSDEQAIQVDASLWFGGDYNRLMLKVEAEKQQGTERETTLDLVYSRIVAPYWDIQAGINFDMVKHEAGDENTRYSAVFGIMGLAPYWFETDLSIYASQHGEVSAVLEMEYEWLLTQRAILQARMETMAALQTVPEYDIYQGVNNIDTGLRVRYEIKRELAPYIGIEYQRKLFSAASSLSSSGLGPSDIVAVAGVRMWF